MESAFSLFGHSLQPHFRAIRRLFAGCLYTTLVLFSCASAANDLVNARQYLSAGKLNEALAVADGYLAKKPNDAHMLFIKGLILTEQNQNAQAIAVFTRLVERYPTLPEPHNNLAVLYASSGQYDKARASLEAAIRTNPSYATAHENMGDLYAKLASQSYDRALQMNSSNTAAKTKLAMLQAMTGDTSAAPAAKSWSRPQASVRSSATSASVASRPSSASRSASVVSAAAPKPEPKPVPKPAPKPEPSSAAGQDEVVKTLNEWAAAWSARDVKRYLGYYASDFKLPSGKSRKAWADERQSRILSKSKISVRAESPQVSISGNTATVKFRQSYKAGSLAVSSRKTMVFVKTGNRWKIQQENAGS